ncbi:MAG: hypothetical protein K8W52_21410 [Deltaproteobacteria bacterium]|nr:hypothetical protein [Deltaproteobacteria bacterium]
MRLRESLFAAMLVLAPHLARADALADRLFKSGQQALAAGKIAEACDAFAASDARTSRVGTLLNLGDCREQNGQIATAWATFLRAAALAQQLPGEHKRADEARRRASYLQPRLSFLTISVAEASNVDGLTITRDGAPIERAYWNQGVPVDGGTYVIEASAPGHDGWRSSVVVAPENARAIVDVPRFKPIGELVPAVQPAPIIATPRAPIARRDPAPASSPPRFTPMRFAALGAAGLALGAGVFGALEGSASARNARDANARCQTPCSDPTGLALGARASHQATVANLAFVGAAAAAVGAVTLWIVGRPAPIRDRVALVPVVGADRASLTLSLEF